MVLHVQPGLVQLAGLRAVCSGLLDEVVKLLLDWVQTHGAHAHQTQRLNLLVQLEHEHLVDHCRRGSTREVAVEIPQK